MTSANHSSLRAGFVPQTEAAGALGYDFRATVEMIREANALVDEAGISLDTDPRRVAKSGAAQDAAQMAAVEIAATGGGSGAARATSTGPSMTETTEPGGSDAAPEPAAAPDRPAPAVPVPTDGRSIVAHRAITAPATVDRAARTVEVVWSTGARARNFVPALGLITEELEMSLNAVRMGALRSTRPFPPMNHGRPRRLKRKSQPFGRRV